jgi:EpsD family peptidyl-prolyl cis-trans isomerase
MELTHKKNISLTLLFLLISGITACGNKESTKPASQIAAKVNSGEISVHQVNYVLSRTPAATKPDAAPKLRREILDRLIDQELAVEQAVEKKLDRAPDVLMTIENARREILARAYVEQIAAGLPKPTVDEAKEYYAAHPQLFAERRIYNIQEIVLPSSEGVANQLGEMLQGGSSMEEIANWLKGKNIKFAAGGATRPAEQIPLELLPKIHPLKVGQGLILQGPQSITVMRLVGAQAVPVTEEVALPRIQQFLANQRASEAAKKEFKTLKANAKITYMGEFADASPSTAETTPASATASAAGEASSALSAPVADIAIDKGVAGLK